MRPVRLGRGSTKKSSAYFFMTFSPAEAGLLVLRPPQLAASLSSENFEMMTAQDRIMIYGPKLKATQPNLKRPLSLS